LEPSTDPSISKAGVGDPRNKGRSPRQARRKAQNGAESEEEAPSQVSTVSGQIYLIYENLEMGNWLVVWNIFYFSFGIRIPSLSYFSEG